jgi:hypothetical protein
MKNNNKSKNNITQNHNDIDYEKEEQSQALEMKIDTSEKLSKRHYELLKNLGLQGILVTDKSLEVLDSGFEEDLIINILKNPDLVESFDDIKNLDINVIKAIIAEGSTELSSLELDDDSVDLANSKLGNLDSLQLKDKRAEEKE